jgi:hypothetical protein
MTDYYSQIRENLNNPKRSFISLSLPEMLEDMLYGLVGRNEDMLRRYRLSELIEEDWDKIKHVCDVYNSPLMRAMMTDS